MKITIMATALFLTAVSAYGQKPKPTSKETRDARLTSSQDTYVITAHTSVPTDGYSNLRDELYTIVHGTDILKVLYSQSQTSSARPGDFPGTGLHMHSSYSNPDLSQIPAAGVAIRACLMDKDRDRDGDLVIARQPTPAPCMARVGNVLQYEPSPNASDFTYVAFDILSETTTTPSTATRARSASPRKDMQDPRAVVPQSPVVAARPAPPRKDIPAIAKAANGAVVSIIMSDKDGHAIAQGTGFLISNDGRIVTKYHVIENGSSAIVKLPDGAFFVVDGVLAFDKARDVAIIKAHGANFRTLTLGNSDRLQVGEEVVAIGNPLSLESTVSNGIVSGVRTVEEEGGKFLQVTTPISPGSSGSPLFNMAGEVVGITTLYLKGGENLNFAIPINDARRLLLTKSSTILALPNEPEPVKAQMHGGDGPPSVSGAASLKDTLQWMQNSLNAGGGDYVEGEKTRSERLMDFSGCYVHFANIASKDGKETFLSEPMFNLDDIDPTTIYLGTYHKGQPDASDLFIAHTRNDAKKITWKVNGAENTDNVVMFSFPVADYSVRFTKAFRHAVNVCGGKPSIF